MWNCGSYSISVDDPPDARNLVVGWWPKEGEEADGTGCTYTDKHVNYDFPWSYTHHRQQVKPRSLFFHQLEERLGEEPTWLMTDAERENNIKKLRRELQDVE